jgi:hypothetical protein
MKNKTIFLTKTITYELDITTDLSDGDLKTIISRHSDDGDLFTDLYYTTENRIGMITRKGNYIIDKIETIN